jgi:phosphoesterase RecJ-like protein
MDSSLFLEKLNTPGKAILSLHRRPDGDSLGSNIALYRVLKAKGHDVTITSIDPVPDFLMFLDDAKSVVVQPPSQVRWHDYQTFWALDMSSVDMIGETVEFPKELDVIVIDHHKTNTNWGKTNIVQPEAVSSTAVLYDIFKQNNIQYDKETAMALLTGLATDTGFFVFINTGGPFQIAGDLIDSHALDYQKIIFNIMRQMNIEDVVFVGNALSKMIVDYEKKVAIIPMPFESDLHYEKLAQSSYLLTNYLQSINGTELGIMVIEEKKGTFRVQFRSRNREFDVGALAFSLGGGGHKNAAGATIQAESIDQAIKKILGTL